MHQLESGMYVSGRAPDSRKRERQLSSGSVATPPYTGGDVSPSGELGRMFDVSSRAPSSAGVGAGVFCLVEWRRWEVLVAACGLALGVAAVFFWNVRRKTAEAERFFRRSPDTVFDQVDMPVGELVKITGQVTCGRLPLGAYFHDAARCVFTSIQMYEHRGWACFCSRWQLKHSETRSTNFYISDRNSGKRFYVRAGQGAKITWMIKRKPVSFDGDRKRASRSLKNWMASNHLSCNGVVRLEEGFIREGDTASVIGVLKRHHAYDVVDAPAGVVATSCQPASCMFPVLVEGLVLIGSEDPDEGVYMV